MGEILSAAAQPGPGNVGKISGAQPASYKLDQATCIFGAGILIKHLDALEEETAGAKAGLKDIEYVHRSRVASRRLRAALPLFESCLPRKKARPWLKGIRNVTRALGAVRDTDVQIEALETFLKTLTDPRMKPGINRLLLRQRQKRSQLQAPLVEALTTLEDSGLISEMRAYLKPLVEQGGEVYLYTPGLYQHSYQSIIGRLNDLLAFDSIVDQPEKVTELHEMRISAKWLRYTLETFAPLYANQLKPYLQTVRKIQESLGDIHDCDVWQVFLPEFLDEERQMILSYFGHLGPLKRLTPGIQAFSENRRLARAEEYGRFVALWQKWQQAGLWADLRKTTNIPLYQPADIYPPRPALPDTAEPPAQAA